MFRINNDGALQTRCGSQSRAPTNFCLRSCAGIARNCYTLRLQQKPGSVSNRGMNVPGKSLFASLLGISLLIGANSSAPAADDPFAWPPITAQQKPWAYNWWMGSAVDKTNLTRELERYAAAGLGGIHIIDRKSTRLNSSHLVIS